jgi:hypothetical protein
LRFGSDRIGFRTSFSLSRSSSGRYSVSLFLKSGLCRGASATLTFSGQEAVDDQENRRARETLVSQVQSLLLVRLPLEICVKRQTIDQSDALF